MASGHDAYAAAGVNYDLLDPGKRLAQAAARATAEHLARHEFSEVGGTRGESAYVIDAGAFYLAFLTEGLGTKNLVADAVRAITGRSHYEEVAQDAVATILNDLATVGAAPLAVSAYWGTGDSEWFADQDRMADLVRGWAAACTAACAAWGGGETQALSGIIQPGDAILIAPSTGIHANGLTLARRLAERLPDGYRTPVPGDPRGRGYGEALLDPSPLYGPLVERLQETGVDVHYAAHVTGHGWRKLMRADRELTYRVRAIPPVPPVLAFLQEQLGIDAAEAYGTFNMGAGFALFVSEVDAERAQSVAAEVGFDLLFAGQVEEGPKQVVIEPLDVTYAAESLRVR